MDAAIGFDFQNYEDMGENRRIIEYMEEIVSRMPEGYTYVPFVRLDVESNVPGCWYLDNEGNTSCFVGRILEKMHWSKEEIAKLEGTTPNLGLGSGIDEDEYIADYWRGLPITALRLLTQIQRMQDIGKPWSDIAEAARSSFNERKLYWFGPEY